MTTQSSARKVSAQISDLAERGMGIRWIRDMRIGTKLTIGFGILVFLMFASAGVAYLGSGQATAKIDQTGDVRVPAALAASHAQANLLRMQSDVRGYLALGDRQYRDSYSQSTLGFESDLAELDALSSNLDSKNQQRLKDLRKAYGDWSQLPEHLFELRDDQLDREPAYQTLAITGTVYAGEVLKNISTMIETQGQQKSPTGDDLALVTDMAKFQGNFAAILSALRGYTTTRNRVFRGEYEVNLIDNQNVWDTLAKKRAGLPTVQQERLDAIQKNRSAFLALPPQMFKDLEGPRWREDLYIFSEQALPLAIEMQQLLNDLVVDQQTLLTSDLDTGRQDLARTNQLILAGGFVALLIGLGLTYIASLNIARPISRLTMVAEQIRSGDLEAQAVVDSKDETGMLAETFNNMTGQLRSTLQQVRKEKQRADGLLDVVIPIGADLASEKNFNLLLERMLMEAKSFCRADGGTLFLRTADEELKYVIVRDDSEQVQMGGTTGREVSLAPLALYEKDTGKPNERLVPARVALQGISINLESAGEAQEFDLSDTRVYTDTCAGSLLAIPLKNRQDQVLGVLQLVDAQDPETGKTIPFDLNLQEMMESFSMLAVAALEAYIREQSLQQQIQQLRIEIDEVKRQKQVSEIVDTDFFQNLTEKAQKMRAQRKSKSSEGGPSKD